jgi:hypothetical protein
MGEDSELLKCSCDHCGQNLEFPAEGVGTEIQCPVCKHTTRLYRPASALVTPPIPPPARPVRPAPPSVKSSVPSSADSKRSAPAKAEFVIRFSRQTVIGALAVAVCLVVLAPFAFWEFRQASEREKAKKELATELRAESGKAKNELAAQLRLMSANLQTGINENDFLQQAARVRATYAGAKAYLTPEQNGKFAQIDLALDGIKYFWDEEISFATKVPNAPEDWAFYDSDSEGAKILKLLNVNPHTHNVPELPGFHYSPKLCVHELMDKTGQAISSFLEDGEQH